MKNCEKANWNIGLRFILILGLGTSLLAGCGSAPKQKKEEFFTSGSREADQRASQRMARAEQLAGQDGNEAKKGQGGSEQLEGRVSLFERLGGEQGIAALVDDFTPRMLQDPRVNWDRTGVDKPGLLKSGPAITWKPTPQNVSTLKKHMVQFISLATGGPSRYEGKEMKQAHADMKITNSEFDAAIGDIKASLDKLKVPDQEQKELLAIIESTRPQIVTQR